MKIKTHLPLLLLLLLVQNVFALEISFNREAEVSDTSIIVADIVDFSESTELTKALGSKIVTKSPRPGESITLQSIEVRNHILRKYTIPGSIVWKGSSSVVVVRKGMEINPKDLLKIIDDFLVTHKNDLPQAEIRFIAKSLPLPFSLPKGDLDAEVIPSNPNIVGSTSISIILRVDGRVRKNLSIKGKIQALAQVAVASAPLRRGSILTPSDTHLVIKDITDYRNPCLNLRKILGKKLKRSLRAGNVIKISDVESPPLVKKGQLVKILINQGGLHISATGVARMDGKANQVIRVQNSSSNKLIFCRVAAPGIVEVQI